MTKMCQATSVGLLLTVGFMVVVSSSGISDGTRSVPLPALEVGHLSSLNGMLFELAAERHAVHSKESRIWVFTFHRESSEVEKYSDGKFVVVSLPAEIQENEVGLCTYVRQYNSLTQCTVDAMARRGKFKEALAYYDILLHFDRCGGGAREQALKKRDCLAKIFRNENPEENQRKYFELCIPVAGHLNLSEIQTKKPTTVTNLLTLEIP